MENNTILAKSLLNLRDYLTFDIGATIPLCNILWVNGCSYHENKAMVVLTGGIWIMTRPSVVVSP